MQPSYKDLIEFHGHSCPGLAMGYRMTLAALNALKQERSPDEELVAVVENDACGVDALQCLTGCTFGKGNLIFRDYGKHVYTLFSRNSQKAVRVVFRFDHVPESLSEDREQFTQWLLKAPEDQVVSLAAVEIPEPEPAQISDTVRCEFCGEGVMATRTRDLKGQPACIPCATRLKLP